MDLLRIVEPGDPDSTYWVVRPYDGAAPLSFHPSREEAVFAARAEITLSGGGSVEVRDLPDSTTRDRHPAAPAAPMAQAQTQAPSPPATSPGPADGGALRTLRRALGRGLVDVAGQAALRRAVAPLVIVAAVLASAAGASPHQTPSAVLRTLVWSLAVLACLATLRAGRRTPRAAGVAGLCLAGGVAVLVMAAGEGAVVSQVLVGGVSGAVVGVTARVRPG